MSLQLTAELILQPTLAAFKKRFPFLFRMGVDFRGAAQPLKLNSQYIAHIRTLPSSAAYGTSTGYANGATSARGLLVDVPITVDKHKHVPLLWEHLHLIKDHKQTWQGAVEDAGYVLGKEAVDSVLRKGHGNSGFSHTVTDTVSNTDRDTLASIAELMNTNGASPFGRIGLVRSSVMTALMDDVDVKSRDYYGQMAGGSALRVLTNVEGFEAIYEYPDFPDNLSYTFTGEADDDKLTIAGASASAPHDFKTADKVRVSNSGGALPTGLSAATTYYVIYDSATTIKLATSEANALAGTAIDLTADGSGTQTIVGYDNTTGLFFENRAIATLYGVPGGTGEAASALGIPMSMRMDPFTEPESGLTMMLVGWQQPGMADVYVSPTMIWGSAVGRQSGAANTITDKAAVRLITA